MTFHAKVETFVLHLSNEREATLPLATTDADQLSIQDDPVFELAQRQASGGG